MIVSLNKKITEYKLIACDLDGTLYDQVKLRMIMATRLTRHYLRHPFSIKELFIIKYFRDIREKWEEISINLPKGYETLSLEDAQYKYVADKYGCERENVKSIITKWMFDNPLDAIALAKDDRLLKCLDALRSKGIKVVILSDYPIEDKINALKFTADGHYSALDANINELKPSPKGLCVIMKDYDLMPQEIVMIGDRDSKDGECARRAGTDYIIIDRKISGRDYTVFD